MLLLLLPVFLLGSAFLAYNWGGLAFAAMAALGVLLFAAGLDLSAVITFASVMAVGAAGGFIIKKKMPLVRYVLIAPFLVTIFFSGDYYYKLMNGIDMVGEVKKQMTDVFMQRDDVSNEDKEAVTGLINAGMDLLKDVILFAIFINALMFSGIAYIVVKHFLFAFKKDAPESGLSSFELNGYTVFALIGTWALVLFAGNENKILFQAALNGALIISALYLVQALGVISFFLKKNKMPDYFIVIVAALLFVMSMSAGFFAAILLAGFGLLDLWADFRKIHTVENNRTAGS